MIVKSCVAIMSDQSARAELALLTRLPDAMIISGDRSKLQQVLLNLLSNALKFADPGGTVTVLVDAVADGSVRHDGTGLGLPLVKSLVERHGGSIAIDSAPGKGTTVTILLPRESAGTVDRGVALERVA